MLMIERTMPLREFLFIWFIRQELLTVVLKWQERSIPELSLESQIDMFWNVDVKVMKLEVEMVEGCEEDEHSDFIPKIFESFWSIDALFVCQSWRYIVRSTPCSIF